MSYCQQAGQNGGYAAGGSTGLLLYSRQTNRSADGMNSRARFVTPESQSF
jgi:hypothetical protein